MRAAFNLFMGLGVWSLLWAEVAAIALIKGNPDRFRLSMLLAQALIGAAILFFAAHKVRRIGK